MLYVYVYIVIALLFFFFRKSILGFSEKPEKNGSKKSKKVFLQKKKKNEKNGKMDSLQKALNLIFSKKVVDQRLFFFVLKICAFFGLGEFLYSIII